MSISAVVTSGSEAASVVQWAWQFARARLTDLTIIINSRTSGKQTDIIDLNSSNCDDDLVVAAVRKQAIRAIDLLASQIEKITNLQPPYDMPTFTIKRVASQSTASQIIEQFDPGRTSLLLVAKRQRLPHQQDQQSLARQLFLQSPCDTILIRPGSDEHIGYGRMLVPTAGGPHAAAALRLAAAVAPLVDGRVDALFVEPNIGEDALHVGRKIIRRIVHHAVGSDQKHVNIRVLLSNDFRQGVAEAVADGYDLVLVGASNQWFMRWFLFSAIPENLMAKDITVVVMRTAIPLTTRLQMAVQQVLERFVPQLDREDRIALAANVQSNSRWNFDFVALVCLSTLIAALGLVQNSAPVVIGPAARTLMRPGRITNALVHHPGDIAMELCSGDISQMSI